MLKFNHALLPDLEDIRRHARGHSWQLCEEESALESQSALFDRWKGHDWPKVLRSQENLVHMPNETLCFCRRPANKNGVPSHENVLFH